MPVELRCGIERGRRFAQRLRADAERLLWLTRLEKSELSLVIVSDRTIRILNRDWRGKDAATDVLSFPQLEDPGRLADAAREGEPLGDIVISVDTALLQARELRVRPAERMRALLVHGFLHLIGYDHERSEAEARRMFARERALAQKLGDVR